MKPSASRPSWHLPTHTWMIQALGLIFFVLTAFSILITAEMRSMAVRTEMSVRQSDLYQLAHYQVGTEESLERKYRLEPGPEVLTKHTEAGAAVVRLLQAARLHGAATEQRTLDQLEAAHERYFLATHQQLFPAVDARDAVKVLDIDHQLVDPVFSELDTQMRQAAQVHHEQAQGLLAQLTRMQNRLAALTPLVFLTGLLSLVLVAVRFRLLQGRIDRANRATLERLTHEATTDSLTGLGNHRAFKEAIAPVGLQPTASGQKLTLVRIDVDDFKTLNDRFGHLQGDQLLMGFGATLGQNFPGRAYRVGGDEFALLLTDDQPTALSRLQALCATVHREGLYTISAGLATMSLSNSDLDELHQQADQALYEAKRRGRNRAVNFAAVSDRAVVLPQAQVQALRQLLQRRQMDVAFQPIWSAGAAAPVAYEALARPGNLGGVLGPQALFDLAVRLNQAAELDELCWTAALQQAADLPSQTLLFINLSPQTLDQEEPLAPRLLQAVQAAGLRPGQVVFEITERSVGHVTAIVAQVQALKAAGFRIALDDLGSGNAGLEMMRSVQADFLKIDRSVVASAPTNPVAHGVLAAVMAFAGATGVTVIAEGIETEAVLSHARSLGDAWAQGYLLGRPMETLKLKSAVLI
jgi:diguanylate cyclase (GGDEF)-like protein